METLKGLKRTHYCGDLRMDNVGEEVILNGWVQKKRNLGGLVFVDLRDIRGISQIIFDADVSKDAFEKAIIATSMEVASLTDKIKNSFEEALRESSDLIAEKTASTMEKSMANIAKMSESFESNQKILAQTIASLPEQTMVYNKSVSGKIQKKLDDIEKAIKND